MRYPAPLTPGSTIAVTGPSGGVEAALHPRLDLVEQHLRSQGYLIKEGRCLRSEHKHVSGDRHSRAKDLVSLWDDPEVDAIIPPWGGILAIEILPLVDFARLAEGPAKWLQGWSDISTVLLPLTLLTDTATVHGTNLIDMVPNQPDPLTAAPLVALTTPSGGSFVQRSSERFVTAWADYAKEPAAVYQMSEPTRWRALGPDPDRAQVLEGRLIGGCLDTLATLVGTPYGDVPSFNRRHARDGVLLYLENCEQRPTDVARILWAMRLAGWLEGLSGLVLGRSAGPDARKPEHLSYREALDSVLGDLPFPVLADADIGHQPPQMTLVNGALATLRYADGKATLEQTLA